MSDFARMAAALNSLERNVRELSAEGWFARWSDDTRVVAILEALDDLESGGAVREPRTPAPESPGDAVATGWPAPEVDPNQTAIPPDYWESAE